VASTKHGAHRSTGERSWRSTDPRSRAYLNDMRAPRNDSVDVNARASDSVDHVISQIDRLLRARRHQGAQLDRDPVGAHP
jgi:hypothetical protein